MFYFHLIKSSWDHFISPYSSTLCYISIRHTEAKINYMQSACELACNRMPPLLGHKCEAVYLWAWWWAWIILVFCWNFSLFQWGNEQNVLWLLNMAHESQTCMKVTTHIFNILWYVSHMEMWYMNRSVCCKQKCLLFLEKEGCFNAFLSTACEFSQQVEASFWCRRKPYTNKYHTACRCYLTVPMNICIKIRFGSSICISKVLGNLWNT